MSRYVPRRLLLGLIGLGVALPLLGCSSEPKGPKRAAKTVESFQATKQNLASANAQIQATNESLRKLTSGEATDLRMAYTDYVKHVEQTDKLAKKARDRAASLRSRTDDYVNAWEAEMKQIDDEELRSRSKQRMAAARAEFQKVVDTGQEVREAYDPYMKSLRDVQTFLANDLTAGGIESAKGKATTTISQGEEVRKKLAALEAELDRVASMWAAKTTTAG